MDGRRRAALVRVNTKLSTLTIDDLLDLPLMTDAGHLAAAELMTHLMASRYLIDPRICAVLTFALVEWALEHGHSGATTFGFGCFAFMLQLEKRGTIPAPTVSASWHEG